MNVDESFQDRDNVIPTHGSFHFNGECLPAELISDVEVLQHPAVTGLIELEVQSPHVIRARSAQSVLRVRGLPRRARLRFFTLTRRPSSRHKRCTRL